MTTPIDWTFVRALAAGLPEACRSQPPDLAAYGAYTARMPDMLERAREVAALWRLLNDRTPGVPIEDEIDVLDNPEWTDAQLAAARPFAEIFPDLAAAGRRVRGKQKTPTKVQIALRVDQDVLDAFRRGGRGWQVRMNAALRKGAGI